MARWSGGLASVGQDWERLSLARVVSVRRLLDDVTTGV